MHCSRCHPLPPPGDPAGPLAALVCGRCGSPLPAPSRGLPLHEWLLWLDRVGLGIAGPLLGVSPRGA